MEKDEVQQVVVHVTLHKTTGPDLGFKELMERISSAAPDTPWEISGTKFSVVTVKFVSTNQPEDGT